MDSLSDILGGRELNQPPEITAIKKYVKREFGAEVGVQIREHDIAITVSSSALANTLRLRGPEIKRLCKLNKKLTFKII